MQFTIEIDDPRLLAGITYAREKSNFYLPLAEQSVQTDQDYVTQLIMGVAKVNADMKDNEDLAVAHQAALTGDFSKFDALRAVYVEAASATTVVAADPVAPVTKTS